MCINMSRTQDSNPPYHYMCNPQNFSKGHYLECELGDLSGKFGFPTHSGDHIYQQLEPLIDYLPPIIANFQTGDNVGSPWYVYIMCEMGYFKK